MPRRTSPRVMYNAGVRWIAEHTKNLTQLESSATRLLAAMCDVNVQAVARHVYIVRSGRAFRQFPLPKSLTPPGPKKQQWIG